jgi:hypothetical protein
MNKITFSDFVLFVAPFPVRSKVVEGWMSRIRAIDEIFEDQARIYLNYLSQAEPDTPPTMNRHGAMAIEYIINPTSWLHRQYVEEAILRCRFGYVQTVHLARNVLEYYPTGKLVTDFHGIVPEEETMMGAPEMGQFYEGVEATVIANSRVIVVVTHAMAAHLTAKYPDCSVEFIVLPIIESHTVDLSKRSARAGREPTVLYSGGTQVWQNIALMAETASAAKLKANYLFLSHDHSIIKTVMDEHGLSMPAEYLVTKRENLADFYLRSDFGFVLRDDVPVNRVACPTKLSEYLQFGIIPIVLSPDIGDFAALRYQYVTWDEFRDGFLPSPEQQDQMVAKNIEILREISSWFNNVAERLRKLRLPNRVKSGTLGGLAIGERHLTFPSRREVYVFGDKTHYFADWAVGTYLSHEVTCTADTYGDLIRLVPMLDSFGAVIRAVQISGSTNGPVPRSAIIQSRAALHSEFDGFDCQAPFVELKLAAGLHVSSIRFEIEFHNVGNSTWKALARAKKQSAQPRFVQLQLNVNGFIVCDDAVQIHYIR